MCLVVLVFGAWCGGVCRADVCNLILAIMPVITGRMGLVWLLIKLRADICMFAERRQDGECHQ